MWKEPAPRFRSVSVRIPSVESVIQENKNKKMEMHGRVVLIVAKEKLVFPRILKVPFILLDPRDTQDLFTHIDLGDMDVVRGQKHNQPRVFFGL